MKKIAKMIDKILVFIFLQTKEKVTVQKTLEKSLTYDEYLRAMMYTDDVVMYHPAYSRASALRWAFNWDETDEGFRYWENIHNDLWLQDKRDKQLVKLRKTAFAVCMMLLCFSVYKLITL